MGGPATEVSFLSHVGRKKLAESNNDRYYVDQPCLVVCGKPSATLAEKLERDERSRITKQRKRLGHEGLKKAEKELEEAKAEHDRPIPTDILTSFPLPDVKTIAWIPVQSYQETGTGRVSRQSPAKSPLSKLITSDGHPLPFFVQYDHVQV
jgi:Zn-dependent M16 (insulinase) family peptidase